MKPKRRRAGSKGTAFVPRIVFQTVFAGVVPAVAAGCGSAVMGNDAQADAAPDAPIITLAVIGFDADGGRDASMAPDVFDVAEAGFDASRPDEGVIVLAVIGFEVDPDATRGETVAQAGTPPRAGARRTPRRGRA
jgi:hypothetical protein